VAIFSKKLIRGESPVINGDGKQTRDYVYVKDVVRANVLSLAKDRHGSFNIGTGIETNVIAVYDGIKKALNSKINAVFGLQRRENRKKLFG